MPTEFPERQFQAFRVGANAFFPTPPIDEDPLETWRHFMMAWLAVRYRYRICAECNDEFKALLANASQLWRAWSADEEQNYKLERCIYLFFMSGLSVFESFGFCLCKAYLNAARRFAQWCEAHGLHELVDVQPFHVAAFVKELQGQFSPPTVKQHLAALRMLLRHQRTSLTLLASIDRRMSP